jgi:hypothetical protein
MNLGGAGLRKLIYLMVIVALLLPLFYLGQPLQRGGDNQFNGRLAQMRSKFELGEGDLGEIDPASATMRLASLGLRGFAATMLWQKAFDYRRRQDWDRMGATINQIALLQPHFENVWTHQSHNQAFNTSIEFDDYRERYAWVERGLRFLMRGVRQNQKAPAMYWQTGMYFQTKLGVSDEKRQFRDLFRKDGEFHTALSAEGLEMDSAEALGPDNKPDSWLVSRLWYQKGYRLVDSGVPLRGKGPIPFYQAGPLCRMHMAEQIESEGWLDERAKDAWIRASADWFAFGDREIDSSWNARIRLGSQAKLTGELLKIFEEFKALVGDTGTKIRDERMAELSDLEKEAMDTPVATRSTEQRALASQVELRILPNYQEIARRVEDPKAKTRALLLSDQMSVIEEGLSQIRLAREICNFTYWQQRAEAEQTDQMLEARRLVAQAEQELSNANPEEAVVAFEKAWVIWKKVFEDYPILILDAASDELSDSIARYERQLDSGRLPEDFPLMDFLKLRAEHANNPDAYTKVYALQAERDEQLKRIKQSEGSSESPPKEAEPADPTAAPKE